MGAGVGGGMSRSFSAVLKILLDIRLLFICLFLSYMSHLLRKYMHLNSRLDNLSLRESQFISEVLIEAAGFQHCLVLLLCRI